MTSRFMLIFAAISGFIFVALGAFGADMAVCSTEFTREGSAQRQRGINGQFIAKFRHSVAGAKTHKL